jgi:hypothetical protein
LIKCLSPECLLISSRYHFKTLDWAIRMNAFRL